MARKNDARSKKENKTARRNDVPNLTKRIPKTVRKNGAPKTAEVKSKKEKTARRENFVNCKENKNNRGSLQILIPYLTLEKFNIKKKKTSRRLKCRKFGKQLHNL